MNEDLKPFLPGDRVIAFDSVGWIIDRYKTPAEIHRDKPATVVARYGTPQYWIGGLCLGPYKDQVDLIFDSRPGEVSKGHFTWGVEELI